MTFFPADLAPKQDAKYFAEKMKDAAIRHEMDGGYTVTRARFTRAPRRTFTTGFSAISNADKSTLTVFYRQMKGGSEAFLWTHPISNEIINVRFVGDLEAKYAGVGQTPLWDVTNIQLEEV